VAEQRRQLSALGEQIGRLEAEVDNRHQLPDIRTFVSDV
jgi:hypothetical protein